MELIIFQAGVSETNWVVYLQIFSWRLMRQLGLPGRKAKLFLAMFTCHFTCISKSNLRCFRGAFVTVPIAIFCAMASGQEPAKPDADAQSGMRTGAPRTPVKDAQMRPITAGGFVDGAGHPKAQHRRQNRVKT